MHRGKGGNPSSDGVLYTEEQNQARQREGAGFVQARIPRNVLISAGSRSMRHSSFRSHSMSGVISHEKRRCFSAVASHLVRNRFYCTGDTISPFFLPNASATSSHHARWADFSFRFTTNVFLIFREPECILTGSRKDSEPFTLN
jgi:hypothetical protein